MDSQSMPSNSNALVDDLFLDEDALEEVEGGAAAHPEPLPCKSGHRRHSQRTPWAF